MKIPDFQGTPAQSFSYPYASSLRNSQVFVKRQLFAECSRVPLREPRYVPEDELEAPASLVVAPNGQHAAAVSRWRIRFLTAVGDYQFIDRQDELPHDVVALDGAVYIRGSASTWEGANFWEGSLQGLGLARRIEGARYAAVTFQKPFRKHPQGSGMTEPFVFLEGGLRHTSPLEDIDWSLDIHYRTGVAAIGGDRATVLALDNGMLQVYAPERADSERLRPALAAERNMGVVATHVSIVGSTIFVIAPEASGSRLLAFTAGARPIYSLAVPFEVLQPAIAGSGTRVYLAGRGLAAVDGGGVSWIYLSPDIIYASSFEDGSLAVANGQRLEFVNTAGVIEQSFDTQEPLIGPPAIAGDGNVWAISERALYIAR